MDSLHIPALSIAVINKGKIVYQRSTGVANIDSKTLVNDQSIFEAASLSKTLFAYFVLTMVDKGLLNLDTPLYHYLPYPDIEKDERYKLITARMALSHQTGFPNWRYFEKADSALHIKYGDLYLKFTPGTQFAYAGEGYFYLSKVLAHLCRKNIKTLDSVFQKSVAGPLRLQHSYFSGNDYVTANKVAGHKEGKVFIKKWPVSFPEQDSSWFGGAGGLHTNAVDYATFLIALMRDKALSKKSSNEMFTAQVEVSPTNPSFTEDGFSSWGLGIAIKKMGEKNLYGHGGNNGNFQSGFIIDKSGRWGFVFFTNCDKGRELNKALQEFLLQ